jgi:hypothetical protein
VPAKIDVDPEPSSLSAYTVFVVGSIARPSGCEPTGCAAAGFEHPVVTVALQLAPLMMDTVAL